MRFSVEMKKHAFRLILISVLVLGLLIGLVGLIAAWQNVDTGITSEDQIYIEKITGIKPFVMATTFDDDVALIRQIQNAAFETAPQIGLIPKRHSREPKDLYESSVAYCGDRARFIDKALRYYGFETRYASLYSKREGQGLFARLLDQGKGGDGSHAVVEVQTSEGWMVVDTRHRWLSLDASGQPVALHDLGGDHEWNVHNLDAPYPLLLQPHFVIYGLYSRHGLFYPPFTPYIPDVNWRELFYNFI